MQCTIDILLMYMESQGACEGDLKKLRGYPSWEPVSSFPLTAFLYAKNVKKGPWPEGEEVIREDGDIYCLYKAMVAPGEI